MKFNTFITEAGTSLLEQSKEITYTRVLYGSGFSDTVDSGIIDLINPKMQTPVTRVHHSDHLEIQTDVAPHQLPDVPFVMHEIGVYAKIEGVTQEVLFAYSYSVEGDMFDKTSLVERTFQFDVHVSSDANISVVVSDSVEWVTKKLFYAHTDNTENPHDVTKHQVGLGNIVDYPYIEASEIMGNGIDKHMVHRDIKYMLDTYLKRHTEASNAVTHKYTKADIGLAQVPNYAEISNAELNDIQLPSGYFIHSEMLEPCIHHLLRHNLIKLEDFVSGDDIQYVSKLKSGTDNIEVSINAETGDTEIRWVGSTAPEVVSWQDIVEGVPGKNTELMKLLSSYLLSSDILQGQGIKIEKLQSIDAHGNKKDRLQFNVILPENLLVPHAVEGSEGVRVTPSMKSVRVGIDLGYVAQSQQVGSVIDTKLQLLEMKLMNIINSGGGIKGAVSTTPSSLQVKIENGILYLTSIGGSGGTGGGGTVDLSNYYTKVESDARYAKKGETDGGGGGTVDLSNYYTKGEIEQKLDGKLGLLDTLPELSTENKTVIGAVNELKARTDAGAQLAMIHDREIEELKKSVGDAKVDLASSITAKGVPTSSSDSFSQMSENILQIEGMPPMPKFTEVTFPFIRKIGSSSPNFVYGGDVIATTLKDRVMIFTRTKEFNWLHSHLTFEKQIKIIRISNYGKYICIGFDGEWQIYETRTLECKHTVMTFIASYNPCFTWDETKFAYFLDTNSLQVYDLEEAKVVKLIRASASPLYYIANDLSGFVTNYYYNVKADNTSEQSYTTKPTHYLENKMYLIESQKLIEVRYDGVTQTNIETGIEAVTQIAMSQSHIFASNSTSKVLRIYDSTYSLVGEYQSNYFPNVVFGSYGHTSNTNNLFYPTFCMYPDIRYAENYSSDTKIFWFNDTLTNKLVRFLRDENENLVFDSYLDIDGAVSSFRCSPSGNILWLYAGNQRFLVQDGVKVDRALGTYRTVTPTDNIDVIFDTSSKFQWDGTAYVSKYSLPGIGEFNRQLTHALPLNKGDFVACLGDSELIKLPCPNISYGRISGTVVSTGTWGEYRSIGESETYGFTLPSSRMASRYGEGYILLTDYGYNYVTNSGAATCYNHLFQYAHVEGNALLGEGFITKLIEV